MRVLILIGSLSGGGAERQVGYLAQGLAAAGELVSVATLSKKQDSVPADVGYPVHALRQDAGSWMAALVGLRRLLKCHDVLYSFMDIANAFGAIANIGIGKPLVWGLRSSGVARGAAARLGFTLSRRLSRFATIAVANSEATLTFYQGSGYAPKRWRVVANGVDTALFRPAAPVRRRHDQSPTGPSQLVVGMVARADRDKRFDLFFAAIAHLRQRIPNMRWMVIGVGTDMEDGLVGQLSRKFAVDDVGQALGEISDVASVMRSFDVLICCSDFEGSSNAVLEAMASGVPVISFDVGDAREMMSDAGVVVATGTVDALAMALGELLNDPATRSEMGLTGRRAAVSRYSSQAMIESTRTMLQDLLAESLERPS